MPAIPYGRGPPEDRATSLARRPPRSCPAVSIGNLLLQTLWAPHLLHRSPQQGSPPGSLPQSPSCSSSSPSNPNISGFLVVSPLANIPPGPFQPRPGRVAKPEEQERSEGICNSPAPDTKVADPPWGNLMREDAFCHHLPIYEHLTPAHIIILKEKSRGRE